MLTELTKADALLLEHIELMLRTVLRQHDKKGSDWTYGHLVVDAFANLLITQADRIQFIDIVHSHLEQTPFKLVRRPK
jgi:hypothetical protein